ncbi:hypothetical protein DCAR_0310949 [Daucus carota subsp. sativus]|uniref:Uncharacterized protein n=1 Tax=Daucus carota subsp. sativus TaxID=79200 RepID=A0A162AH05_DAUCS|nr:PREDICTED: uncharacterized protein LOC108213198 [Daucus carota subsp. sativus]WOG91699.1 hypothetical protein DCAR_0310949 [Daucus carota subsp. sativus]
MKKFFSELKLCYGGGSNTDSTAEDTTMTLPQPEKVVPLSIYYATGKKEIDTYASSGKISRRLKKLHSAANWKPVLSDILENNVIVSDVAFPRTRKQTTVVRSEVKASGKRKSAGSSASFYSDKYRKSTDPASLPAFSPTPYVF